MIAALMGTLTVLRLIGQAIAAWWNDNLMRLGASIAYYTLFAIAPILLIAVSPWREPCSATRRCAAKSPARLTGS